MFGNVCLFCQLISGLLIYFFRILNHSVDYSCASFSAKIQSMKNSVPKNDKKRRKQLTEEIAKLEADLNQKHEEELRQLISTVDTKVREFLKNFVNSPFACCMLFITL